MFSGQNINVGWSEYRIVFTDAFTVNAKLALAIKYNFLGIYQCFVLGIQLNIV